MVAPARPKKPLLLLQMFPDQGQQNLAGKNITFKSQTFDAGVIDWAVIDRSIPCPPGLIQISDAVVTLQDTENDIRQLFDDVTPIRRLASIIFEDENSPTSNGGSLLPPIYTGEISPGGKMPTAQAEVPLRDVTAAWLDRKIPNLIIRDNFPNLPDYIELAFAPIIFGVVESYSAVNIEPQGVIKCTLVDTTTNRYCVARHRCHSIIQVYRKSTKQSALFQPVSSSEFSVITENKTIGDIVYAFTYIQFHSAQPYGTEIHADVGGLDKRYDFVSQSFQDTADPIRNPVDCAVMLIYYLLEDEINIQRFDRDSHIETIQRCVDKFYVCDGAVTDQETGGETISHIYADFNIDFFQTSHGLIKVHLYDSELDANDVVLISDRFVLRQSMAPEIPREIFNRIRYRFFRQNGLLSEYVKSAASGQWGQEDIVDYVPDQAELGATGENPILEKVLELRFIRDENVAFNVIKRRLGYWTLRSYPAEFDLPLPEFIDLDLTQLLSVTHFAGMSKTGWTDKVLRTFQLRQDLKSWILTVRAMVVAHISDADIIWTHGNQPHDPQIIYPQLGLLVGDGRTYLDYPNSDPQGRLSDTSPAAPSSSSDDEVTIPSTFNFTSTSGGSRAIPKSRVSFTNVRWQEDRTTSPRSISGYVPVLIDGAELFAGTLFPDQRPTGLTSADVYRVLFYSTDFDHLYIYVGTSETGTPTGWRAIEQTCGNIFLRWDNPVTPGWHKCDGSSVRTSDYGGSTSIVTLPNLYPGTHTAASLLGVGSSPIVSATPSLTENATLPSCLGATGIIIDEAILVPWMRL